MEVKLFNKKQKRKTRLSRRRWHKVFLTKRSLKIKKTSNKNSPEKHWQSMTMNLMNWLQICSWVREFIAGFYSKKVKEECSRTNSLNHRQVKFMIRKIRHIYWLMLFSIIQTSLFICNQSTKSMKLSFNFMKQSLGNTLCFMMSFSEILGMSKFMNLKTMG